MNMHLRTFYADVNARVHMRVLSEVAGVALWFTSHKVCVRAHFKASVRVQKIILPILSYKYLCQKIPQYYSQSYSCTRVRAPDL